MDQRAKKTHPAVPHPVKIRDDLSRYERRFRGRVAKVNDWLASNLGVAFGSVWVVWVFFIWPLVAQAMGPVVKSETQYYTQSWIQLFALPLFVYIGNKLQKSTDAQSDAIHEALTHIAIQQDKDTELLRQLVATIAALSRESDETPADPAD